MNYLLSFFLFFSSEKLADPDFIAICKEGSTIKLEYLNSIYGISNIKTEVVGNTLLLNVYISKATNKTTTVILPHDTIETIKINSKIFIFNNVINCKKKISGEEAIEYINSLR